MTTHLVLRVIHIVCAALWVGSAVMSAVIIFPTMRELGPDAAKVGAAFDRRKLGMLVGMIALFTVLTGIWLYWLYTGGFSPEVSRSHAGMAYGAGGLCGIIGFIIGVSVLSPSMVRASKLMAQVATLPAGADRGPLMAQAGRLRHRAEIATRIVAVLVVVAATLMAAALYL